MFRAKVTKGFKYELVKPVSMLEARLFGAVTQVTKMHHKRGQIVEFATHREFKEFRKLAADYGGKVELVSIPTFWGN
jgi:hypothetical protein